jgi:hypothetical protein
MTRPSQSRVFWRFSWEKEKTRIKSQGLESESFNESFREKEKIGHIVLKKQICVQNWGNNLHFLPQYTLCGDHGGENGMQLANLNTFWVQILVYLVTSLFFAKRDSDSSLTRTSICLRGPKSVETRRKYVENCD